MNFEKIVGRINQLKNGETKEIIDERMEQFRKNGKNPNKIFSELCFCLLTANFNANGAIKIQNKIGHEFSTLSEKQLAKKLKELGHRFPNKRAEYISLASKQRQNIFNTLKTFHGEELRNWIVENIKGLGYKEASHFLRNIGFENYAIIDFHIIDVLVKNKIIKRPNPLTKKKYLEIEKILEIIAGETKLSLGKLDLYLWYMETGKILK